MRIIRLEGVEVTLKELVRCHFQDLPLNAHTLDRYRTVLAAGSGLLEPVAGVEFLDETAMKGFISRIETILPETFGQLLPLRQSCAGAYLIFCTIGPRLEQEVQKNCQNNEVTRGFILDALGSLGVAKYARHVEVLLAREAAARRLKIGAPVMPGTRGIDLELNHLLFDLVKPEIIGMHLTEHALMVPSKSISMILGVGRNPDSGAVGHNCHSCDKEARCFLKELWRCTDESSPPESLNHRFQITDA